MMWIATDDRAPLAGLDLCHAGTDVAQVLREKIRLRIELASYGVGSDDTFSHGQSLSLVERELV